MRAETLADGSRGGPPIDLWRFLLSVSCWLLVHVEHYIPHGCEDLELLILTLMLVGTIATQKRMSES